MESLTLLKPLDVTFTLANIKEKFAYVRQLLDKRDHNTLENAPYKNKYKAITTLQDIETQLTTAINGSDVGEECKKKIHILLARINLQIGILHTDTEETKAGEDCFNKCMELVKDRELEPEAVPIALTVLNQLGIVWSQWNQPLKAKVLLERAEYIYKIFTDNSTNDTCEPINILSYFGIEDNTEGRNPKETLEELHTMTLYYLVQIYKSIKDYSKSALYCHKTLYRQLGDANNLKDLDYVDWALNVATLSQYFMENQFFPQARYHLAVAIYILQKYEEILKRRKGDKNVDEEMLAADWENYKHRRADVARCWGKYGISLMSVSKQRLLQKVEKDDQSSETESDNDGDSNSSNASRNTCEGKLEGAMTNQLHVLKFCIREDDIKPIVDQVTSYFLLDFSDAKKVFLNTQKWLEEAKTYYTLENHASDYVQIVQDMSQTFKYLTFFEENEDKQAQMHKRRIDILESVAKELNPQYYKPVCRQIWIELGDTYSEILHIKCERLRTSDVEVTAHALAKVNRLAKSAIKNFQSFLDSIDENRTKIADDVLQPTLLAYFRVGILYDKIITSDKKMQLINTQNSVNAYQFVVDYCEKDPKAADIMRVQLSFCTELIPLLTLKADMLKLQIIVE